MYLTSPFEQLQRLANQVSERPETQLLRFDKKHNSYCFERKWRFCGTLSRLLFCRRDEYDFDKNLLAIEGLFKAVFQDRDLTLDQRESLNRLENRLERLINHVDARRKALSIGKRSQDMQVSTEQKIESLRRSLSDKATETHVSRPIKKGDECIAAFQFEEAFGLYKTAIADKARDRLSVLDKFVDVGLLLKKYDEIQEVIASIQSVEPSATVTLREIKGRHERQDRQNQLLGAKKAEITQRITRSRSFGEGPKNEFGFTQVEWQLLVEFSITFKQEISGVLTTDRAKWVDFFLYATGNSDFNQRLKNAPLIQDQYLLAACEYFAAYSFKSDPKKWEENRIAIEHAHLVWQRFQERRELQANLSLTQKFASQPITRDMFKAEGHERAFQPEPSIAPAVSSAKKPPVKNGKGKKSKRVLQEVQAKVEPAPRLEPEAWKQQAYNQALQGRESCLPLLHAKIQAGRQKIERIESALLAMQRAHPDHIKSDPFKLQPKELFILDSLATFRQTFSEDMHQAIGLDKRPFFAGAYAILRTLEDVYEGILTECSAGGEKYKTGDISFVNELKKVAIVDQKDEAMSDKLARLLFPFGHMALIDMESGSISFSHQRLQFDHSELRLQDFVFYDSYRLDFSQLIKSEDLRKVLLSQIVLETKSEPSHLKLRDLKAEAELKGMTEDEFLLEEIEELYEIAFSDVLEGQKSANAQKFSRIAGGKPSLTKFSTIEDLLKWVEDANRGTVDESKKITPLDLLNRDDGNDEEIDKDRQLRIEFLQHLYRGITNDEKAQFRAYAKSWLFAAPLAPIVHLFDKAIDLAKLEVHGEMVCSQFALILTIKALQRLESSLTERALALGLQPVKFLNIPTVGKLEYAAATTEFMLKKIQELLRPLQAPGILSEIINLPPSYLRPIPIDSTLVYMAKMLFGAYTY